MITALLLGSFSINGAKAADNGPLHGRPRYENKDGKEWIYYLTEFGTDWYLAPKGETHGDLFMIQIRGVSPGVDNYGLLQINCSKKLASAYYNPWEVIPVKSRLLNGIYGQFCNLPIDRN